jgi:CYTH domain-containing protein
MKLEIERKFLVRPSMEAALVQSGGQRFTQGYLSGKPSVRVRLDYGGKAWLTIKGEAIEDEVDEHGQKGAPSREEYEYEIPVADGRAATCRPSTQRSASRSSPRTKAPGRSRGRASETFRP